MRQSPTRIRHRFSSPLILMQPGGLGLLVSAIAAERILFLTGRSSLFSSRCACEVRTTSYIDLTGTAQLVKYFAQRTSWLIFGLFGDSDYVLVLTPFSIFVEWKDHRGFLAVCVNDVLNITGHASHSFPIQIF